MKRHTVVYGMASLLVVYQEALHVATVLISEIIARVLKTGMIELTVLYGTASLLVVILEGLRVMTMLITEVFARVLTRGLIELTVAYGIASLLVVILEVLRVNADNRSFCPGPNEGIDRTHCCVWDSKPACCYPGGSSCNDNADNRSFFPGPDEGIE